MRAELVPHHRVSVQAVSSYVELSIILPLIKSITYALYVQRTNDQYSLLPSGLLGEVMVARNLEITKTQPPDFLNDNYLISIYIYFKSL